MYGIYVGAYFTGGEHPADHVGTVITARIDSWCWSPGEEFNGIQILNYKLDH